MTFVAATKIQALTGSNPGDGADLLEEGKDEKKSSREGRSKSRSSSRQDCSQPKGKKGKSDSSEETQINTLVNAKKLQQIQSLEEFDPSELYYLVYIRSKSPKEISLEAKVSRYSPLNFYTVSFEIPDDRLIFKTGTDVILHRNSSTCQRWKEARALAAPPLARGCCPSSRGKGSRSTRATSRLRGSVELRSPSSVHSWTA